MENIQTLLKVLTSIQGVSGFEESVIQAISNHLQNDADELQLDAVGNLYALKRGKKKGPTLMVAAHADQIGAVVRYIHPDGFIYFEKIGGWTDTLLQGQRVSVQGHFGVIGCKSGHYQSSRDDSILQYNQLYIDVGASSREEVAKMGITIGSSISYLDSIQYFTNKERICGAALDNRLGCAILMKTLADLGEFPGDLLATFTVQEETGFKGAMAAVKKRPDFFLALDTIPAGGTPDLREEELLTKIGEGPVFPILSGHDDKVTFTNKRIRELLIQTAQEEGVPYQLVIADRGNNDAAGPNLVGSGIPSASLCIPRRYSHSPVEVADLEDITSTLKVLSGFIHRMGELVGSGSPMSRI